MKFMTTLCHTIQSCTNSHEISKPRIHEVILGCKLHLMCRTLQCRTSFEVQKCTQHGLMHPSWFNA